MEKRSKKRTQLNQYINQRYPRLLEYSNFQCNRSRLPGHGQDLLHEVIYKLFLKDENKLYDLYLNKKNRYTELDFFILRMIKVNATSNTAPYRYKNVDTAISSRIDANTDVYSLELPEEVRSFHGRRNDLILAQMRQIRKVYSSLLTPDEKAVFEWIFFEDQGVKDLAKAGFSQYKIYKLRKSAILKLKEFFRDHPVDIA